MRIFNMKLLASFLAFYSLISQHTFFIKKTPTIRRGTNTI